MIDFADSHPGYFYILWRPKTVIRFDAPTRLDRIGAKPDIGFKFQLHGHEREMKLQLL
jgi:hypothetical protein